MAYTTPATFTDANVLSASALNSLADAIAELQSAAETVVTPWLIRTATSTTGETLKAQMRHAHRYLHWSVRFGSAGHGDHLTLTIYPESGGSHVLYDNSSPNNQYYSEVEDLDGLLDDGDFYEIRLFVEIDSGGGQCDWTGCSERSTT